MLILMLFVVCGLRGMEERGTVEVVAQQQATPENLAKAIYDGNLESVKQILEDNKSLANQSFDELSIFHTAIRKACEDKANQNKVKIVEEFLNAGAEVDTKDKDGETSLNIAIKNGDEGQIIDLLLKKQASIDDFDPVFQTVNTPLQSAVRLRKVKIVELLLRVKNLTIQFETLIKAANRVVNFDNPDNLRISREIFNLIWRYYLGPKGIEKFKRDLTAFVKETQEELFQKNTELLLKAGVWIITLIRYCGVQRPTSEKKRLRLRLLNAYKIYRYGQMKSGARTSFNTLKRAKKWITDHMNLFVAWVKYSSNP